MWLSAWLITSPQFYVPKAASVRKAKANIPKLYDAFVRLHPDKKGAVEGPRNRYVMHHEMSAFSRHHFFAFLYSVHLLRLSAEDFKISDASIQFPGYENAVQTV